MARVFNFRRLNIFGFIYYTSVIYIRTTTINKKVDINITVKVRDNGLYKSHLVSISFHLIFDGEKYCYVSKHISTPLHSTIILPFLFTSFVHADSSLFFSSSSSSSSFEQQDHLIPKGDTTRNASSSSSPSSSSSSWLHQITSFANELPLGNFTWQCNPRHKKK